MKLYQRIGTLFTCFSLAALVVNLFTPDNPNHIINLFLTGGFALLFALSSIVPRASGQALQTWFLCSASFFPLLASDIASTFFGGAIAVVALVLIYAYGGYRTLSFWKLPVTVAGLFIVCLSASLLAGELPVLEACVRAFAWTLFVFVLCLILWIVADSMEVEFHEEYSSLIVKQNRTLLEELKKKGGGCDDGDG